MAEKVEKLSVHREKDFMYYVKDGAVWKVQRKQPGVEKGKPEKVADGTFEMDTDFIYFVDRDGDVSRAKRAVGGQKRKQTIAPVKLITGRGAGSKAAKSSRGKASTTGTGAARGKKAASRGGKPAGKPAAKGKAAARSRSMPTSKAKSGSKSRSTAKPGKGKAAKRKSGR